MRDLTEDAPEVWEELVEEEMPPPAETVGDGDPSPTPSPTAKPTGKGDPWPELEDAALHGLAGDALSVIEPHTEADPAAVLIHLLAMFGNAVGPQPHYRVEADRHRANLFGLVVGKSSKGRKGVAERQGRRLLSLADFVWARDRISHGLSSGEGLISAVSGEPPAGGAPKGEAAGQASPPSGDRRLLVIEAEFAATLRAMSREGNVLSAVLRQAWDSVDLRVLTRKDPLKATGAHVSVIGHITADELLRRLDDTEASNGFANRFLFICARRSKELPDGGNLTDADLRPLSERLREALDAARRVSEVKRDSRASALWHAEYSELSKERPGLLGSVTSRAEAQVVRLSLIYALLDCSATIREEHLRAALAVWNYAAASARNVFGDRTGNRVADRILEGLRECPDGIGRSDISDLFGRNVSATAIERALALLTQFKLATAEKRRAGQGRPTEWWTAR